MSTFFCVHIRIVISRTTAALDDTPQGFGKNALAGFAKALATIENRREREGGAVYADMTSEEIARNEASIKLHKILSDSTKELTVGSPLAAWNLVFGERFMASHLFTKVLLTQAVAYVRGENVTHKLVGKNEHVIPVVETCHYAFRGQQLWDLSAMEFAMAYTLAEKSATIKVPESNACEIARCEMTGQPHLHRLPQRVCLTESHPLAKTHFLRRNPAIHVPEVCTRRMLCPEQLCGDVSSEIPSKVATDSLAYLCLLKPWRGATGKTTLGDDVTHPEAAFQKFRGAEGRRGTCGTFASTLLAHDDNEHLLKQTGRVRDESGPDDVMDRGLGEDDEEMELEEELPDAFSEFDGIHGDGVMGGAARTVFASAAALPRGTKPERREFWAYPRGRPLCPRCSVAAAAVFAVSDEDAESGWRCPKCHREVVTLEQEARLDPCSGGQRFVDMVPRPVPVAAAGAGEADRIVPSVTDLVAALKVAASWEACSTKDFDASIPDAMLVKISKEFTLNAEQHQALVLLAAALIRGLDKDQGGSNDSLNHLLTKLCGGDKPLHHILLGDGGTGKSTTIRALLAFAQTVGLRNRVALSASTGSAAALIGGGTFHSLFATQQKEVEKEKRDELSRYYLAIVDELSMLSLDLIGRAAKKAQLCRGDTSNTWGGLSVCMVGDFQQLPPVRAEPMYRKLGGSTKSTRQLGCASWNGVNAVTILKVPNRTKDPDLVLVNEALRTGVMDRKTERLIRSCIHVCHGGSREPTPGATVVCHRKKDANEVNSMAVHRRAAALKRPVVRLSCLVDNSGHLSTAAGCSYFVNCKINEPEVQLKRTKGTKGHRSEVGILRHVDVFMGMRLMVPTAQVGNRLLESTGLGNGSRAEVVGFANDAGIPVTPSDPGWCTVTVALPDGSTTEVVKPPPGAVEFLLLKLIDSTVPFKYYGLESGVLPWRRQTWTVNELGKFTQFSVRPTFGMTIHKVL